MAIWFTQSDVLIDAEPRQRVDGRDVQDGGNVRFDVAETIAVDPAFEHGRPHGERRDKQADTEVGDGQRHEEVLVEQREHVGGEEHQQNEHVRGDDEDGHGQRDDRLDANRHHSVVIAPQST